MNKTTTGFPKLGELTTNCQLIGTRDAMHVAVIMVTCDVEVKPGHSVEFLPTSTDDHKKVFLSPRREAIVDPFLTNIVQPGEPFWVIVSQAMVTNIRHHYDIKSEEDVDDSSLYDRSEDEKQDEWCKTVCDE
jgi:hypothetical protein